MNKVSVAILAFIAGIAIIAGQYIALLSLAFFLLVYINLPEKEQKNNPPRQR